MKSSKPFTASTCDVFVKEWELHLFIIYYLFRYIHVFFIHGSLMFTYLIQRMSEYTRTLLNGTPCLDITSSIETTDCPLGSV